MKPGLTERNAVKQYLDEEEKITIFCNATTTCENITEKKFILLDVCK